ncbi:hypothetical protein ACQKEN_18055 [Pseudomonas sp. NPDC078416]
MDRRELAEQLKTIQAPADSYAIGEINDEAALPGRRKRGLVDLLQ